MRLIDADALIRKFKTASPMAIDGRARQMVEEMPTIVPERKRGRWLEARDEDPYYYICSECGHGHDFEDPFCPGCGAKMQEEEP